MEIVRAKGGIIKLTATKPSTTYIGNWGILDSIAYLSERSKVDEQPIMARLFMGKKKLLKSKIDFVLSKKDIEDEIQLQWEGLR
jgi:hypothetical protein